MSKQKSIAKKRRAALMKHCMSVLEDKEAADARKDRMARMLMPYLFTKKSGRAPKMPKGFAADGTPKGKKGQRKAASMDSTKGSKWDGLLPSNDTRN